MMKRKRSSTPEEDVAACIAGLLEKRREIVKKLEEERVKRDDTLTSVSDFGSEATELIKGRTSLSQAVMVPCTPPQGDAAALTPPRGEFVQDSYAVTPGEPSAFTDPLNLPWSDQSVPDSYAQPAFQYDDQTPPTKAKSESSAAGTPLGKYLSGNRSEIVVDTSKIPLGLKGYRWAVNEENILHQAGYIIPPENEEYRYSVAVGGGECTLCVWSAEVALFYILGDEGEKPCRAADDIAADEKASSLSVRRVGKVTPSEGNFFSTVLVPPELDLVFFGTTKGQLLSCKTPTPTALTPLTPTPLHTSPINCTISHSWSSDELLIFTAADCVKITPLLSPLWDPAESIVMPLPGGQPSSCVVHHLSLLDENRPLLAGTVSTARSGTLFLVWDYQQGTLLRKLDAPSGVRQFTAIQGAVGLSVLWTLPGSNSISRSSWLGTAWTQEPIVTSRQQISTWAATSNTGYVFSSTASHLSVHSVATGTLTAELNLLDGRQLITSPHKNQPPRYTVTSIAMHPSQPIVCFTDSSGLLWIYVAS